MIWNIFEQNILWYASLESLDASKWIKLFKIESAVDELYFTCIYCFTKCVISSTCDYIIISMWRIMFPWINFNWNSRVRIEKEEPDQRLGPRYSNKTHLHTDHNLESIQIISDYYHMRPQLKNIVKYFYKNQHWNYMKNVNKCLFCCALRTSFLSSRVLRNSKSNKFTKECNRKTKNSVFHWLI